MNYKTYGVQAASKRPLLDFICSALEQQGCTILACSSAKEAPFRIGFETRAGERMGILCYVFEATFTPTKGRPQDEHSFQIKYGTKESSKEQVIYHDPYGLYTTLLCGINPKKGFFVGVDPVLRNPTKFFIRVEFKDKEVQHILQEGWHAWERDRRGTDEPVEIMVGGKQDHLLQYIQFERLAKGMDPGHRQLLAETMLHMAAPPPLSLPALVVPPVPVLVAPPPVIPTPPVIHPLASELNLSEAEILNLIASASRLKMAVRGWVAEEHLSRTLEKVQDVTDCKRLNTDGGADVSLRYQGSRELTLQCKNVLRETLADGTVRLDFQRTRAPKADPCGRYYEPKEFDVVAACMHAITLKWEFKYTLPGCLDPHPKCKGRLSNNVRIDKRWDEGIELVLAAAAKT